MSNYVRNGLAGPLAPVNAELEKIESSLKDKLDRFPEQGQANQLSADLDANGNRIINVPAPENPSDLVRLGDLEELTGNPSGAILPPQSGQAGEYLRTDGENAYWDSITALDLPSVYPEDFGAVGDGVTDDTEALQATIDSVKGRGVLGLPLGHIILKSKTYTHTGLVIDRAVSIRGEDRNASRLKCLDTANAGITVSLAHDGNNYQTSGRMGPTVAITDVLIESSKTFANSNHGILLADADTNPIRGWVYLNGVDIHSMGGSGLFANTWEGAVKATNCKFLNSTGKHLNATSCADWQFIGCEFGVTPDDNILLSGSAAFTFTTCNIYSSTGDLVTLFTDAAATAPVNHHFVSCSFDRSSQGHGVVYNVRNDGNVTFTNCYWTKNGQGAAETYSDIWIDGSVGRGPTIVGGWMEDPNTSDSLYNIFFNGPNSSCYTTNVQFEAGNARSTNVTNSVPQLKFEGAENFDTFADLEASTWPEIGDEVKVVAGANAPFIIKDAGSYTALAGDRTLANSRVGALQDKSKVEAYDDIYDAVSSVDAKISGTYTQDSTATVSMNGDSLFDFDYSLSVANSTTTLGFTPFANGASFVNVKLDGGTTESGGTRNRTAHMINLSGTSVDGVEIKSSEITGWTFPILKSNATGGTQTRFNVTGNYFHDNYGVDALFNSPATGSLIDNVIVSGNTFGDNLAEDIGGFSHRISMAGHVENFVVTGNIAFGQGNEIWRAEEAARNGVVTGNAAQLGDRHGIEVTDNNVGGVAYTPSQIVISNNALEGQGLAGTRGLHFTFDGSGLHPIEKSICGGNIISNWETGVRLARKASLNDNSGNVINDCDIGVLSQEPTLTVDNTLMTNVTTKFDADSGGLFGSVNLRDTTSDTPLFTNVVDAAGNPAAVTGWTYESGLFATDNAANTYIPVIEMGAGFNLDIVIYFGREAGNYSFVRGVLDWDGTTLTFTENHRTQAGSLVLSGGAPFRENAGNLEVNIFAGSPAVYSNCRLQIKTTGVHVFD